MTVTEQLSALDNILAHGDLHSVFQPIVSLSQRSILGYEALTRGPSNSPLHSPINLFAIARLAGRLSELELACRKSACKRFNQLGLSGKLFLNISPDSLMEPDHKPGCTLKMLQTHGIAPSNVVIELTEHSPTHDFQLLDTALHHYRAMGFNIALDDLGAGYSSLRLWSELRPDFVKIDRHFIDGIHLDPVKREFVGSILKMASASRAEVIAEGIELGEEFDVLANMGVDLLQGYYICRPQDPPPRDAGTILPREDSAADHTSEASGGLQELLHPQKAIRQHTTTCQVLDAFRADSTLNTLAVLDDQDQPIGIVHRHSLSEALLKPFAAEIFTRKPISRLMSEDYLRVEMSQSLQQVSRLLTSRARQRIEEDFIITQNGRYAGLGRAMDLLKLITDEKIQQARYANPLTQLPGNVPIQKRLSKALSEPREALICYVDIDHFKPFNDHFGYARGDEVLLCLARCLSSFINHSEEFIGHIGGDDFILLLDASNGPHKLEQMLEDFRAKCRRFFRAEDLQAGFFSGEDREGKPQQFPLLTLSIGVVRVHANNGCRLDSDDLANLASQAKHQAKAEPGYSLHIIDTLALSA